MGLLHFHQLLYDNIGVEHFHCVLVCLLLEQSLFKNLLVELLLDGEDLFLCVLELVLQLLQTNFVGV